mgnify:CR=1 FL=1
MRLTFICKVRLLKVDWQTNLIQQGAIVNKYLFFSLLILLAACAERTATVGEPIAIEVHLNEVGFEPIGSKSAIITSAKHINLSGQAFTVQKGDKTVLNGRLNRLNDFNEWQVDGIAKRYYRADFSELHDVGQFTLVLDIGSNQTRSASFIIEQNAIFNSTTAAVLSYFKHSRNDQRYNWQQDQHIRIYGSQRYVDVRGGWNDAGGDTGKYLSHLSYANFFNPQQLALVGWALAYSYQSIPTHYQQLGLSEQVLDEVFWGADYLHRILDPEGYFYMTVFDQWNTNNADRVVTAYTGADGDYTEDYQAAFRQGAGVAIAALARAYMVSQSTGEHGEFTGQQYLQDAERAFAHLQINNPRYCDDGVENIIDDYSALLAAIELYRATGSNEYLLAANQRANNLVNRVSEQGWFISNALDSKNLRPFYHAAEAGFPVFSLMQYLEIANNDEQQANVESAINKHMSYQLALNTSVENPYNYARQSFKTYQSGKLSTQLQQGFFIPHANETGYWWQGESARLSSLAAAAVSSMTLTEGDNKSELMTFATNQLDWTLGRNPYGLTMLNGFGSKNPIPYKGLEMVYGGISNGITGAKETADGRGIEFGPETTWQNWRWVEQWLPHGTWFLIATTEIAKYNQQ